MGRWIALIVALSAAFLLARTAELTPTPASVNAPVSEFSTGRAMADVRIIAKTPHPTGSAANAAVRDHLLARMAALGLETEVHRADGLNQRTSGDDVFVGGGRIENLIGVLPGRDRTAPALALMAHYDSVPGSPGAADDAAGVAAGLEVVRALKTQGQPARDVILLITDGEEAGLLGAKAFFGQHAMAERIGFMINLEARGNGGRAQMFETGRQNGEVMELFRETAVTPTASSLAVFMYENMPNDTDFTVPKADGIPGLNYAFIGRQFDYHMPSSTPENLDQGSVQDLGGQVLAVAREAAFGATLPAKAPDQTFSSTWGSFVLAYPPVLGWGILLLSTLLSAVGAWRAREEGLHWRDLLKGVGASLYAALAAAALLRLARRAASEAGPGFLEQHVLLAQVTRWEIALALVAVGALLYATAAVGIGRMRLAAGGLALAAGVACSAFGGWDAVGLGLGAAAGAAALLTFGRPGGITGVWAGVLLTGFLLALALQIAAPTTAFLVAWPLTVAALAAAISGFGAASRGPAMLVILAALAAGACAWLLGFAHGVFIGLDMPELLALFVFLCGFTLWPLAQPAEGDRAARLAGLAVMLAGFLGVALVRLDPPWTERHPEPTSVIYHVNADTGRAWRGNLAPSQNDWTKAALTGDGGAISRQTLIGLRRPLDAAPAKAVAAQAPTVTLTRQADGVLALKAVPPAGARNLGLEVRPTVALAGATINGLPVKALEKPGQWTRIRWIASPEGMTLTFRANGPGAVETRYSATTEQWPAEAKPLPPRPATSMAFDISNSTVVAGSRRFTW